MGLAGAKNKRKISKDPNNTKWSRNTDSFGHKILRSHGWEPGQYLGAKDASHAEFLTAASASHIRTVLKDDNLGLGARRNQGDECTGLDAFQQLLGRLNGKAEDVLEAEQKARSDVKMNFYLNRKYGTIRFVRGGFLVGDLVQELRDKTKEAQSKEEDASDASATVFREPSETKPKKEKRSKKRKVDESGVDAEAEAKSERKKSKKRKAIEAVDGEDAEASGRKEKKDKKWRRDKAKDEEEATAQETTTEDAELEASGTKRKKEKKDKKDKKNKSKKGDEAAEDAGSDAQFSKKKKKRKEDGGASEPAQAPAGLSTPTDSSYSAPLSSSRHLARKRFIAQKKLAVMDPAALNQIFMIKA